MMSTNDSARAVAERIRSGRSFLITSHRNPDGDALGSGLGLQRLLRQMGKKASMQVRDGFHPALRHIPGADAVAVTDTLPADYPKGYDAVFTMECPEVERTGYPVLPGPVVNIDHHLGNTMYGEINYLDLDAPSVGEMVLQLNRQELHLPLDAEAATALYVSLWINESNSRGSIRLLGLCLSTLQITPDGKVATLELPKRFFVEAGATPEETEGIVNYGRAIDGVVVAALLKEIDARSTRVSMRAKPGVDVQAVASMFGGGGHKAAAGCTMPFALAEAKGKLVALLEEAV